VSDGQVVHKLFCSPNPSSHIWQVFEFVQVAQFAGQASSV